MTVCATQDRILNPCFSLNLAVSCEPEQEVHEAGAHGDLAPAQGEHDAERGLAFPLTSGGLLFASGGIIDDRAGSLEVEFMPRTAMSRGTLIGAWGQYEPLLELAGDTFAQLVLHVYGQRLPILIHLKADTLYAMRLAWDHTWGIMLEVEPEGADVQRLCRRLSWQAFGQQYVPFTIGGMATQPRFRSWCKQFDGWIRSVKVWDVPRRVPGPAAASASVASAPVLVPPAPGIRVLEVDHPPILPDPLDLQMIPDRLEDLQKTREVADLETVTAHTKTEIETFAALTHWVAHLWPHCNYWPWEPDKQRDIFWKRGWEMIPEIQAGRMGGMCGGYAHVMEEVFWAMGFQARRIQVTGHSSFEAYSNEAGKWIVCDASYNERCHMLADLQGALLGAADLIRRYEALEQDAQALADLQVLVCCEENLEPRPFRDMVGCYDHLGFCMGHDADYNTRPMVWYYRAPERAAADKTVLDAERGDRLVEDLDHLIPSRNRVQPRFSWQQTGEVLRVEAGAVATPFLDAIQVAVDDGEARPLGASFAWRLHAGVNGIRMWTRNRLGAEGQPFGMRLWRQP